MNIILSRHGNTFNAQDRVVWTGTRNDFPLVYEGILQAEKFAAVLNLQGIQLAAVYCGPLQRTTQYANIISQKLKLSFSPSVDPRINEIDYGKWTGLTQEEVVDRFGYKAFCDWSERCLWPENGSWGGSVDQVKMEVHSFVQDLVSRHHANDTVVVVSSNGRLRYFLTLVDLQFEKSIQAGSFKVKTGNICKLKWEKTKATLCYWDVEPRVEFIV